MKHTIRTAGGFTLIEVAMATAIIDLGVAAMMVTVGSGTRAGAAGQQLTDGLFLAQEVREYLIKQPYDAVAALGTFTWSPPHDAQGGAIDGKTGWAQVVQVTYRNPDNLQAVSATATDMLHVDVSVTCNNVVVTSTSFIIARVGP